MIKGMLGKYTYDDKLYIMFVNGENNVDTINIDKNGNINSLSKEENEINDKILGEIHKHKYKYLQDVVYNEEKYKLYYGYFNDKIYISKLVEGKEYACSPEEYKELYDMYKLQEVFYLATGYNSDNDSKGQKEKSLSKVKTLFIKMGITVIAVTVMSGMLASCTLSRSDNTMKTTEIHEQVESKEEQQFKEDVAKFLNENGYNEENGYTQEEINYLIEQAWDAYIQFQNINLGKEQPQQEENEQQEEINENDFSKGARRIIKSVMENENLKQEEKQFIINTYKDVFEYIGNNSKIAPEKVDELCERMATLKIKYNKQDDGYINDKDFPGIKIAGMYYEDENSIEIYNGENFEDSNCHSVLSHEIHHAIGSLGKIRWITMWLNEGYTEMYNPRPSGAYKNNQLFIMILEEIYGEDFIKEAYYNQDFVMRFYEEIRRNWNISINKSISRKKYG